MKEEKEKFKYFVYERWEKTLQKVWENVFFMNNFLNGRSNYLIFNIHL